MEQAVIMEEYDTDFINGEYMANLIKAFSKYPEHLEQQLEPGGKMVLPAGKESQYLYLSENSESGFRRKQILAVRFVPMISED